MTAEALDKDNAWSSLREEYIEYTLLGALCREFWNRDMRVEILRAHTDQGGFDIVMELGRSQRHIQIKSSFCGAATSVQKVNRMLEEKAGGCVVWVLFDKATLAIDHYLWFGASDPSDETPSLGERAVKHTKGNAQGVKAVRPGIRRLNKGDFQKVASTADLASLLFPRHLTDIQGSPSA